MHTQYTTGHNIVYFIYATVNVNGLALDIWATTAKCH